MTLEKKLFGKKKSMLFRMDEGRLIKLYDPEIGLKDVIHDCCMTEFLLKRGASCVLSYDLTNIRGAYGLIYHLPDVRTLGQVISAEPERMEYWAEAFADFFCSIQDISMEEDSVEEAEEVFVSWVKKGMREFDPKLEKSMENIIHSIPKRNSLVLGNLHCGNVLVWHGNLFLLDIDQIYIGHPIYGISKMFLEYELGQKDGNAFMVEHFGLTIEQTEQFWIKFKEAYRKRPGCTRFYQSCSEIWYF